MPGLIDGHSHLALIADVRTLQQMTWDEIGARMAVRATETLMRGFTSVRDLGGPVMGLKKAVDAGLVDGPRIYPSGAILTQTSGHGDFRSPLDLHPFLDGGTSNMQRLGYFRIVDGPAQVLAAVRENLRNGATQIKLMGSGGVGSDYDPIDSVQFRPEEIRAATGAVADWDTYAGAHLHNGPAIERALQNGVRSIDHASQMTEAAMRLLVENGASMNPNFGWNKLVLQAGFLTEFQREKARIVLDNIDENIRLIRKYDVEITFNVDAFGDTTASGKASTSPSSPSARSTFPTTKSCVRSPRSRRASWPCPGGATPIRASSASSSRAPTPTCSSWPEIRWRMPPYWPTRTRTSC